MAHWKNWVRVAHEFDCTLPKQHCCKKTTNILIAQVIGVTTVWTVQGIFSFLPHTLYKTCTMNTSTKSRKDTTMSISLITILLAMSVVNYVPNRYVEVLFWLWWNKITFLTSLLIKRAYCYLEGCEHSIYMFVSGAWIFANVS